LIKIIQTLQSNCELQLATMNNEFNEARETGFAFCQEQLLIEQMIEQATKGSCKIQDSSPNH